MKRNFIEFLKIFSSNLFITTRKQQDKFDQALVFLNQIVNQLRHDAGLQTPEPSRTIRNLKELLLLCVGKAMYVLIFTFYLLILVLRILNFIKL